MTLPNELEAAFEKEWKTGETRRITHMHKEDGSDCSINKNPALSILRKADGWWYHCFRCGLSGFHSDTHKTPQEVEKELKALRQEFEYCVYDKILLPIDYIPLKEDRPPPDGVPNQAYHWLWKYSIESETYEKFSVGWSDTYNRCIIPLYEYAKAGDEIAKKLIGWIGRDCRENVTKEQRAKEGVAKYLTKKQKGYKRVYFHAPADSNTYVIVEDVLSAMKVWASSNVNALALLNTFISSELLLKLRNKKIILWLDNDQLTNMINVVSKGGALGMDISHIHTTHDPKYYNKFATQQIIKEASL